MNNTLEIFKGAKNIEFNGRTYFEEVKAELPVFTLTDIPAEKWNSMAKRTNTKVFIEKFDRQPKDYEEVLRWVYSTLDSEDVPEKYKSHLAGNEMTFNY